MHSLVINCRMCLNIQKMKKKWKRPIQAILFTNVMLTSILESTNWIESYWLHCIKLEKKIIYARTEHLPSTWVDVCATRSTLCAKSTHACNTAHCSIIINDCIVLSSSMTEKKNSHAGIWICIRWIKVWRSNYYGDIAVPSARLYSLGQKLIKEVLKSRPAQNGYQCKQSLIVPNV